MLEKQLYPFETDPVAIKDTLRATADKVLREEQYYKDLTPEEVAAYDAQHSQDSIKVRRIKREIKEFTAWKNEEKKKLEASMDIALTAVETGQVMVTGDLYLIACHETRMMGTYNELGNLISSRPLKPEERQTNLLSISRQHAAANDKY
jgi:hypothetical protein